MIMKENMISIGLDIGTTKIVAMIGQTNEYNKMKILGVGKSISLGVHRGVVNNITQTIQSIQQAVSEAEELSGIKVDGVTVGIAGQHIRSLQHSDYITRNNSEQVIDEKGKLGWILKGSHNPKKISSDKILLIGTQKNQRLKKKIDHETSLVDVLKIHCLQYDEKDRPIKYGKSSMEELFLKIDL